MRPLPDPSTAPPRRDRPTAGSRIARVSVALGAPLMGWQRLAADIGAERLPDGRPAYGIVVVSTPRQAGKTTLARAVCVDGMTARPDARVWSTAQTRNAARDRWTDGARALRRSPVFGAATSLRLANGSESATLSNGSTWRPFAPLPDAIHGETLTRALLDEAWAFDRVRGTELLQAIIPAGATVPEFQLWIVSAAGDDTSEFLADLIGAGAAGINAGTGVAAIVWSADTDEHAPDMVERVIAAHPAVDLTITADKIREAAAVMEPREFLRAYGNTWTATTATLFPEHLVSPVLLPSDTRPGGAAVTLSADVAPDRGSAAAAVAWHDTDLGRDVAAVIAAGSGAGWIVEVLAGASRRYACPVTLDPIGPTAGLADDLRRAGVAVNTLTTREVTTAAADLLGVIVAGSVGLVSDPALLAALSVAARRTVGRDAWAFDRRGAAGDIAPLIATAHALYALRRPAAVPFLVI
jgi:hypothetical protein